MYEKSELFLTPSTKSLYVLNDYFNFKIKS